MTSSSSISAPGRRTVLAAAAWSVPVVSLSVAAPAHALSGDTTTAKLAPARVQPGETSTLSVTVVDGAGTPVSGRGVALSSSDDGITASPDSGATDVQGVFTSTISIGTEVATGDYAISASTSEGSTAAVLSVAGALMLSVSSTRLRSDGQVAVSVRLIDDQARPIPGETITLQASGALVLDDDTLQTDANGSARTVLRGDPSQDPGQASVQASDENGHSDAATVLVVDPIEMTIDPDAIERGATARATVTAYDAHANPQAGRSISVSVTEEVDGDTQPSTQVVPQPSSVTTGSDGRAIVDLVAAADAASTTYTVTAAAGGDSASGTLEVLAPVVPVAVDVTPSLVKWGATAQVRVTLTNSDRTPAAHTAVTITWEGNDLTVSPSSGQSDANGVFSATAQVSSSPSSSGSRRITATSGAFSGAADLEIDAVRQQITGFTRPLRVLVTDTTAWVLDGTRLVVVDTSTNSVTSRISLPATCTALAASAPTSPASLYLATDDGRVFVFDVASRTVTKTIARPGGAHEVAQISVHATARRAYVALPRDGVVMVIDTDTNSYLTSVTATWPVGVAGGRGASSGLYYIVDGDGVLHWMQTSDNAQTRTLRLRVAADVVAPMAVSSDGERGYVLASDGQTTNLAVVNLKQPRLLARVPLGGNPTGIVVSPDGSRVLLSTMSPDGLTSVSTSTYQVVKSYNAGEATSSLAVQGGSTAYVTNFSATQPGVTVVDVR